MNHSDAEVLELALCEVLRQFGHFAAPAVRVIPYQTPGRDSSIPDPSRYYPSVDVRAAPPETDESDCTRACVLALFVGTAYQDDQDRAVLRATYATVQTLCDTLFRQMRGTAGAELQAFLAEIAKLEPHITVGGLGFLPGTGPDDQNGVHVIGINFRVAYSRSDF